MSFYSQYYFHKCSFGNLAAERAVFPFWYSYNKTCHTYFFLSIYTVFWYGTGILKWSEEELKEMDRKSRKLPTMHWVHHPRADTDLYTKRANGRWLVSVEDGIRIGLESWMRYFSQIRKLRDAGVLKAEKILKRKEEVHEYYDRCIADQGNYFKWDNVKT